MWFLTDSFKVHTVKLAGPYSALQIPKLCYYLPKIHLSTMFLSLLLSIFQIANCVHMNSIPRLLVAIFALLLTLFVTSCTIIIIISTSLYYATQIYLDVFLRTNLSNPLLICTWILKNQFGKIKFDELNF